MGKNNSNRISKTEAESLAIHVLAFLTEDEEQISRFFGLTGLNPETVREHARDPSFLIAVLDYLMTDESLLLVYCSNSGVDPSLIGPARSALETGE